MLDNGVTYEQLTEAIINGQGSAEINELKAEINALKGDVDKKLTDRDVQAKQQVLAEMKRDAEQLVADGDEFELIRETRTVPEVMRLIEKTYDETGEVLEVQEACQLVEDELFKRQQKLTNLKKMQGLYKPAEQPVAQRAQPMMRTLTNKDTASIPLGRKERALGAFNGTLKR